MLTETTKSSVHIQIQYNIFFLCHKGIYFAYDFYNLTFHYSTTLITALNFSETEQKVEFSFGLQKILIKPLSDF